MLPIRVPTRERVDWTAVSATGGFVRLTTLAVDATARVRDTDLDAETRDLLRGLGLTDGSLLRVCKQGNPCVVQVRATRIGLTRRVARAVMVEPVLGPPVGPTP